MAQANVRVKDKATAGKGAPTNPPAPEHMNFDDFLLWAERQDGRWELHDGRPVRKHDPARGQAERFGHLTIKGEIYIALKHAVKQAAEKKCEALPDGATVKIDDQHGYEPDAVVYCGERADRDSLVVPDPVIVVEVLSPSTAQKDLSDKLDDYFSLESVRHYLVIDPDSEKIWHYHREAGHIAVMRVSGPQLTLTPPGLTVDLSEIFS